MKVQPIRLRNRSRRRRQLQQRRKSGRPGPMRRGSRTQKYASRSKSSGKLRRVQARAASRRGEVRAVIRARHFIVPQTQRNQMSARWVGRDRPQGRSHMRLIRAAICISAYASTACAQTEPNLDRLSASQPIHGSPSSLDEDKGQPSPQGGPTGPITTGSGGVTASNPQGGTPPNMQPKSADQK
jgi:hypothetical protein